MLTSSQAALVNRMLGRVNPHTVTITRRIATGTTDGEGRRVYTTVTVPDVPCRIVYKSGRELVDGEWYTVGTWSCRLPPETNITVRDSVTDEAGRVFEVETVDYGRLPDGTPTLVRCGLRHIDTGEVAH